MEFNRDSDTGGEGVRSSEAIGELYDAVLQDAFRL